MNQCGAFLTTSDYRVIFPNSRTQQAPYAWFTTKIHKTCHSLCSVSQTTVLTMNDLTIHLQPDLEARTLSLNLGLGNDGEVSVRSCEVLGRGFRNRTSFQDRNDISEVLVEKLALAIRLCLQTLPEGKYVLSLPEFLVELPGLALYGAHLLVMELKNGLQNAIFRFKEFVGSVNSAFHIDIGFHDPLPTQAERLATNVLADICMPLLNICHEFKFSDPAVAAHLPAGFSEKAREFEFHTELLKRFVSNAGIGHATPAQGHLDAPDILQSLPLKLE